MMKMVDGKRGLKFLSAILMFLVLSVILSYAQAGATDININGTPWRLNGNGLDINPDGSINLEAAPVTNNEGFITGTVDVPNAIVYLKELGAYQGIAKYTIIDRFRNFSFNNLPDGKYEVFPVMDGIIFSPSALSITIPTSTGSTPTRNINTAAGGTTFKGNFAVTCSIYGTVNGLSSTATYEVTLTIKNPDGTTRGLITSTTNDVSNGFLSYIFPDLEAGLDYTVTLKNLTANTSKTVGSVKNLQGDRAVNDIQVSSTPSVAYILSVTKGGNGTGTVSGTGISCGSDCSETYASTTSVTLTATPDAGSTFAGWSGACTGQSTQCVVSVSSPNGTVSATASFNLAGSYALNVSKNGSGTVSGTGISCGSDCSETFTASTSVTLTASPDGGSYFSGWTGDCSGAGTCSLTVNANKNVTANFLPSGTVDAPACSSTGGTTSSTPKCLTPNADTFTYRESLSPGQVKYYKVVPLAGLTNLTVEYVSSDQLADCSIFVQQGSIKDIATNLTNVYNYVVANGLMGLRYNSTIGGINTFSQFSRQTSEGVRIQNPVAGTGYYIAVKNMSTTLTAQIILYSTNY